MRLVFHSALATEVVLLIVNEVKMRFLTLDTLQYYGVVQTCRQTGRCARFAFGGKGRQLTAGRLRRR